MALDAKLLREKAAEQQLAAGTPVAEIPNKAQADVDAVMGWVNGPTSPPPPVVPPTPPAPPQ